MPHRNGAKIRMSPVARGAIVAVCVLVVVVALAGERDLTATPEVKFDSVESHCHGPWPDNVAVARVFRAVDGVGVGAILQTPTQWIGPSGGVIATFSPLPVTLRGRYGPVTAIDANGIAIANDAHGRDRLIVLRIRSLGASSKLHKTWPGYRWYEFWSGDFEPVCTWMPL